MNQHSAGTEHTTGEPGTHGVPSNAAIAGHPIHPVLIPYPVAFLTAPVVTDVLWWVTGSELWPPFSLWLTAAGVVSGLVAAIAGLIDFTTIPRVREHGTGWFHSAAAVLALGAGGISWALRVGDEAEAIVPWGLTLAAVTAVLVGVAGWYGGELSYRHGIGVTGHE